MALVSFPNHQGPILGVLPQWVGFGNTNRTIDAAGESVSIGGRIYWETGPGTSHTVSSSGGKISYRPGTVTFAAAAGGSVCRVGMQDTGAAGLEDGTYDVYKDLVSATDAITSNVVNTAVMANGSKTITHGDHVHTVLELTARTSPDSIIVPTYAPLSMTMPYSTVDSGAGPGLIAGYPLITITADDGTIGWYGADSYAALWEAATAFGTSSNPDEVLLAFTVAQRLSVVGLCALLSNLAAVDDLQGILYRDPFGSTPVAERVIAQNMALAAVGGYWERSFTEAFTLEPGVQYGVAIRPTTTNTLSYTRLNFGASNGALRGPTPLGTSWSTYFRDGNTGAFGSQDTTILPCLGMRIGSAENGFGARARYQLGVA